MNPDSMLSIISKVAGFIVGPDKAQQGCNIAREMFLSGNYENSKAGMMKALMDRQVSQNQFSQMAGLLNHPWAQKANGFLGAFMPGAANALNQVSQQINAEYERKGTSTPNSSAHSGVNSEFPPLRKR